jgi:hypothetical protein
MRLKQSSNGLACLGIALSLWAARLLAMAGGEDDDESCECTAYDARRPSAKCRLTPLFSAGRRTARRLAIGTAAAVGRPDRRWPARRLPCLFSSNEGAGQPPCCRIAKTTARRRVAGGARMSCARLTVAHTDCASARRTARKCPSCTRATQSVCARASKGRHGGIPSAPPLGLVPRRAATATTSRRQRRRAPSDRAEGAPPQLLAWPSWRVHRFCNPFCFRQTASCCCCCCCRGGWLLLSAKLRCERHSGPRWRRLLKRILSALANATCRSSVQTAAPFRARRR